MKKIIVASFVLLSFTLPLRAGNCSWITLPDINVTNIYSVFSTTPYTIASAFSFRCTPNTASTVTLSRGASPTFDPRRMVISNPPPGYAGSFLLYNMYDRSGQIWGDGSGGTASVDFVASSKDKVYEAVDGAVINVILGAGNNVPPGIYVDTITATLAWSGGGGPIVRQFQVTTTVRPECVVSSFSLPFGTYDPLATTPSDANTIVNVHCTPSTAATISLDAGQWSAGGTRNMRHASGSLMAYNIFKDAARLTIWNATNFNSATSASKFNALGGGFVGYGRVPPGQDVAAGSYTDTVQAVVNY